MVVSELNRRLAWLKVTVCLGLPWLRPNHNVAPGNRMSPWPCASLRICASPTSNQELKNWCVGSLSLSPPACPVSFSCFSRCLSHPYYIHPILSVWHSCLPDGLTAVALALYPLPQLSSCSTSSSTKMTLVFCRIALNAVTMLCITQPAPELITVAISFWIIWSQVQLPPQDDTQKTQAGGANTMRLSKLVRLIGKQTARPRGVGGNVCLCRPWRKQKTGEKLK